MFNIVFSGEESQIKYIAVSIYSIVKNTSAQKGFAELFLAKEQKDSKDEKKILEINLSGISHTLRDFNALKQSEKQEGYIFHILSDFISEENKEKLESLVLDLSDIYPCWLKIHILSSDMFKKEPKIFGDYLDYFKLKIPELIDVDICLYLSSDMLVCCDIRELFCIDMGDNFACAVCDFLAASKYEAIGNGVKFRNRVEWFHPLKFSYEYFNTDLLLLNMPKCRELKIYQTSLQLMNSHNLQFSSQELLNHLFGKNIVILSFAYNFLFSIYNKYSQMICRNEGIDFEINYHRKIMNVAFDKPLIYNFLHIKPYENPLDMSWKYLDYTPIYALKEYQKALKLWHRSALQIRQFKSELAIIKNEVDASVFLDYVRHTSASLSARDAELSLVLKRLKMRTEIFFLVLLILLLVEVILNIVM